jgi:hypothetical protein
LISQGRGHTEKVGPVQVYSWGVYWPRARGGGAFDFWGECWSRSASAGGRNGVTTFHVLERMLKSYPIAFPKGEPQANAKPPNKSLVIHHAHPVHAPAYTAYRAPRQSRAHTRSPAAHRTTHKPAHQRLAYTRSSRLLYRTTPQPHLFNLTVSASNRAGHLTLQHLLDDLPHLLSIERFFEPRIVNLSKKGLCL